MTLISKIYDKSVFSKYFAQDDAAVLAWSANVLEKLIADGTIANYIKREDDDGNSSDFEDLFEPTCIFFSYFVQLARQFELFKEDEFLSNQYLLNQGQFTCGEETIEQLVYLIQNSYRIRSQRGGIKMIEKSFDSDGPIITWGYGDAVLWDDDDEVLSDDSSGPLSISGELLRLVCWDVFTFFKLGVARHQFNSWNINNSSPNYRGCTGRYDLNIGYEYTEDVEDLSLYPLINPELIFLTRYRGKDCMEIEWGGGIGADDTTKRIIIDPRINYEITFSVAQDITDENITFGCLAFDIDGNRVDLHSVVTGEATNFFFNTRRLNQAGRFYKIRGILFSQDKDLVSADDGKLNIGFGRNLRLNENVVSIIPYIILDTDISDDSESGVGSFDSTSISTAIDGPFDSSGNESYDGQPSIFLWNIKVTPCSLPYGRCYLNNKNFIDLILDNKNGRYSDLQIDDILRKYFIPYNSAFKVLYLNEI